MKKLKKILLIDDDEVNNYLNKRLLENLEVGEEIEVLTNGRQGYDYLLNHCNLPESVCPELVIFDHHMPVMDGVELINALNSLNFLQEKQVVFFLLGVSTSEVDFEYFRKMGVKEFTRKPLSEEAVMDLVKRYWPED